MLLGKIVEKRQDTNHTNAKKSKLNND